MCELFNMLSTTYKYNLFSALHQTEDTSPNENKIKTRTLQNRYFPNKLEYIQFQEVYLHGPAVSLKNLLMHKECLPWNECFTYRGELMYYSAIV